LTGKIVNENFYIIKYKSNVFESEHVLTGKIVNENKFDYEFRNS